MCMPDWNVVMIDLLLILNTHFMHFTGLKKYYSKLSLFSCKETISTNVDQLVNHKNVRKMISDNQIFCSLKKIRRTSQHFHNTMLDVRTKSRQFGLLFSWLVLLLNSIGLKWYRLLFANIGNYIQVVVRQYWQTLTDKQVNAMDWSSKVNYLKRNPVTVAKKIDYVFK